MLDIIINIIGDGISYSIINFKVEILVYIYYSINLFLSYLRQFYIQNVPGKKVSMLGDHSICHFKSGLASVSAISAILSTALPTSLIS